MPKDNSKKLRQIYKITNLINGKLYIGKYTVGNKDYFASGKLINRAKDKYGIENFKREVIEEGEWDLKYQNEREIFWIGFYNTFLDRTIGYNLTSGGDGGDTISNHPNKDEISKNNSIAHTGKPIPNFNFSEKAREHLLRVSKNNKGKKQTPEHIANNRKSKTGWHMTDEQKQRVSEGRKGKGFGCWSEERKLNYIPHNKGKKVEDFYECIYCEKTITGLGNYNRWHNDNCKQNPNKLNL